MASESVADKVAIVDALVAALVVIVVLSKARPVGALVSMMMFSPVEAEETLPAASVALAVSVCEPAAKAEDVIDQLPPVAVLVPNTVVPSESYTVTVVPDSAVPVNVGVVSLVMSSLLELPESVPLVMLGVEVAAGALVSSV